MTSLASIKSNLLSFQTNTLKCVRATKAEPNRLAAARYRAPRQKPDVPVILIASSHDQLVNTTCSKQIASQWQCPLSLHPYSGHDLPLDDPHWLAEVIMEHMIIRR
ncbi:alpha/beta fold hydrolase [Corallincola spongiicola]|nr:alpha/beta hydrolase [Corallincola spongiicola]